MAGTARPGASRLPERLLKGSDHSHEVLPLRDRGPITRAHSNEVVRPPKIGRKGRIATNEKAAENLPARYRDRRRTTGDCQPGGPMRKRPRRTSSSMLSHDAPTAPVTLGALPGRRNGHISASEWVSGEHNTLRRIF